MWDVLRVGLGIGDMLFVIERTYNGWNVYLLRHVNGAGGLHQDLIEINFLVVSDREE